MACFCAIRSMLLDAETSEIKVSSNQGSFRPIDVSARWSMRGRRTGWWWTSRLWTWRRSRGCARECGRAAAGRFGLGRGCHCGDGARRELRAALAAERALGRLGSGGPGASTSTKHFVTIDRTPTRNRSRSPGAFCAGISMHEVALFSEDRAHQLVVGALLRRLAEEYRVEVSLVWRQAYGGHGRMKHELNDYLRALRQQREPLPDLIVAATDANCKGLNVRPRDCGPRPTNTAGGSRHSGPAYRALAAARRRCIQGRVRSRLPSPGPEMRSRSLQAASCRPRRLMGPHGVALTSRHPPADDPV